MTSKIQYSKKFADGSIIVVGGENVDEFEINYEQFRLSAVGKRLLTEVSRVQESAPQQSNGEAEVVTLPDDAVLEISHKGDRYWGEVSPFPGTKYSVKVWPEVLEVIPNYDPLTTPLQNVGGWTCKFTRNEKGYPSKIVAFG